MIDPKNPDYSNTPISPLRPHFDYIPDDPTTQPALTIVTPFYNTGAIFSETVQSILQQSLQQFEWIIVNDGSTDAESLDLLDLYRYMDPRVRIVDHQTNQGLPAARNTGFHEAQTKYILYIDSDDILEPTAAEKWLWFLEGHPEYSFAGGYSTGFGAYEYLWQSGFQDMEANLEQNRINHVLMIRKNVLEATEGYDEDLRNGLEDWEFWLHCASLGYWGNSIPEYLHWYRTRQSHIDRWDGFQEDQRQALYEEFKRRYPELWKEQGFPHPRANVDLQLLQLREDLPYSNLLKKKKQRLLVLAPWMIMGGAEKFNLDLVGQLSDSGWEITIVSTAVSPDPWQPEFERLTPDVFSLSHIIEWADYPRFLKTIIRSRQIDTILVTGSHEAYRLLPYLQAQFPETPILDFLHMVTPNWMEGGFPRYSLLFQSSIELTITSSQQVKNWLIANGADQNRIEVCTTNVHVDTWKPDRDKRNEIRSQSEIGDETTLILYIGRIEQQKQPAVFAQTIRNLSLENMDFSCLVIGDGSMKSWLEEFINEHDLDKQIKFLGDVASGKVNHWMAAGDIIFLPSENEGISLTFYEGMACGLVPVGADVGGQNELVTPECGYLITRGTTEEEVKQYTQILGELIRDPEKRMKMGQLGRERVSRSFRLDQMAQRMEELFNAAKKLQIVSPRRVANQASAGLLARQSVEYMRAMQAYQEEKKEEIRLDQLSKDYAQEIARLVENPPMPPAPAMTYLYFAIRQLLYPVFIKFTRSKLLHKTQTWVKQRLVK